MILDLRFHYSDFVSLRPDRTRVLRDVLCREVVEVPELSEDEAPVAISYDERGVPTVLRLVGDRPYRRMSEDGVGRVDRESILRRAADGTFACARPGANAVEEDDPRIVARPDMAEKRGKVLGRVEGLVLVGDEAWAPIGPEPCLHVALRGDRAVASVSKLPADWPDALRFNVGDADFVPLALEAMYPDRRFALEMPRFELPAPEAFREPFETHSLASVAETLLEALQTNLQSRPKDALIAYADLRDSRPRTWHDLGPKEPVDVSAPRTIRAIRDALPFVKVTRRLAEDFERRTRRWEAYSGHVADRRARTEEAEDADVAGLAVLAP